MLNAALPAAALGIRGQTVARYLDIMVGCADVKANPQIVVYSLSSS